MSLSLPMAPAENSSVPKKQRLLPQSQGIGFLIYGVPAAASRMRGFHLTVSPLPIVAPEVKLSQWDTKQSKKQFTLLAISFLPRGAIGEISALE